MIRKPRADLREYRHIQLENGFSAILISDSENTNMSGAALAVGVGSLDEPDEYPGLAHFLEHMVFMGTEKYPGENEFSDFLDNNSGYTNAFTEYS
jgi:secreted Zn-dependent insulinase-like peptidase